MAGESWNETEEESNAGSKKPGKESAKNGDGQEKRMREREYGGSEGSKGSDMSPSECREEIERKRKRKRPKEKTKSRAGNREETVEDRDVEEVRAKRRERKDKTRGGTKAAGT